MCLGILDSIRNCKPSTLLPPKKRVSALTRGKGGYVLHPLQSMAPEENSSTIDSTIVRRSANYHPTIWNYDYIQSLTSEYMGEAFTQKIDKLKGEVTMMFHKVVDPIKQLELIDILQRLGVSYHFEDEIRRILENKHDTHHSGDACKKKSLYATAVEFRLLRQHGYHVPQETFKSFFNEEGNFKECLCIDIEGMLALYEASFHLRNGESILEEVRDLATKHLKEYVDQGKDQYLCMMVSHALELPLHWRVIRLEARWFIDAYKKREDMNRTLLKLAELDYNMVQAVHQEDLKEVSRWWRSTGLGDLSFARDRVVENFLWATGAIIQPQFGYERRMLAKLGALLTTIDDVYDVYGTLEELELFTNAIEKWDINGMEQLPYYLQICFLSVYNTINEMAFDTLKEKGCNIISYMKKGWADICRSYLLEANWFYNRYTPSLQEYLECAWITVTIPNILVHCYFFVTNPIIEEALDSLEEYPDIIRLPSFIVRLADDLGTSTDELKRGDNPKSIQCYMNDTDASEEEARQYMRFLISATWKKINGECIASSPFSKTFNEITMNIARVSQFMYQHGDGHGIGDGETKDCVQALFIHPIPIAKN
ncbi:myrcene synthase, chloroplastic-like [Juglans regia]|uniref:Myrcene synthase, chloroplastic-like n=1 Tax=Juglans regia TaxID=51240 RepID=A0A6P9DXA0_JUGRE|nr:myrcene synthase, chloroplastic-like [Juglans regia]